MASDERQAESVQYVIVQRGRVIICITCGFISHHPRDVQERYCAMCRVFHEDDERTARLRDADRAAIGGKEPS